MLESTCQHQRESRKYDFPICLSEQACEFQRAYDMENGVYCGKRFFVAMFQEIISEDLRAERGANK